MSISTNDIKGKKLLSLNHFKNLIESDSFNEYDILAFLIFIRNTIVPSNDEYSYIRDFCDWIAHSNRDRGVAYTAIKGAMDNSIGNRYVITEDGKVLGYTGIPEKVLFNQWKELLDELLIETTEAIVRHLIICTFSLVQDSCIHNKEGMNTDVELIITKDGQDISLNTHEHKQDIQTVVFARIHGIETNTDIIGKVIEVIRNEDGILTIVDKDKRVLATCR